MTRDAITHDEELIRLLDWYREAGADEAVLWMESPYEGGALAELEAGERERSGIASLKVGYHRVFGYYLEVPRSRAGEVPEEYEPRQTLAATQRFRSAELTALEDAACPGAGACGAPRGPKRRSARELPGRPWRSSSRDGRCSSGWWFRTGWSISWCVSSERWASR